jgi:hypothetical protein
MFFLHHANVDRLLSLWAAVNPGVWVSPGPALQGGSFTISANSPLDQKTSMSIELRIRLDTHSPSQASHLSGTRRRGSGPPRR